MNQTITVDVSAIVAKLKPKLERVAAAAKMLVDALNDLPPEVRKMAKVDLAARILDMD